MAPDDYLLSRIAWLYYIEEMTQKEIANRFGLSRVKVVRLLKDARERGLVEFRISGLGASYLPLERSLRQTFGLQDAMVVETPSSPEKLRADLGQAAATYMSRVMKPDMLVGLGMGRTLAEIPQHLQSVAGTCHFIEMVGGIGLGVRFDSYKLSSLLADRCGGEVEHLFTPLIVETSAARQVLLSDRQIWSVLERAGRSDLALVSVGTVDLDSFLFLAGYVDESGIRALAERRAVGDVLGHFFDVQGHAVPCLTDDRLIGLTLGELSRIPKVICVAGGMSKVLSIVGALRGRYVNVLITDADTAQALLDYSDSGARR